MSLLGFRLFQTAVAHKNVQMAAVHFVNRFNKQIAIGFFLIASLAHMEFLIASKAVQDVWESLDCKIVVHKFI